MKLIFFTKSLEDLSTEEIAEVAVNLGFDGLDLAIRPGHSVNPSNVRQALPKAMEVWRKSGLCVPLVTLKGAATDPTQTEVENVFEACGQAGIPYIKLGYWVWEHGRHYWSEVEIIREALSHFQEMGRKYGICSLVHTHSDEYYGVNVSSAMHLVRGFDPRYIGVYIDPAHLALDGEYLPMALDIARDYLKMVGVKNARYQLSTAQGEKWTRDWCLLAEGLVDWPATIQLLKDAGYDGSLSVHGEYSISEERAEVLKLVEKDIAYLKPFMGVRS